MSPPREPPPPPPPTAADWIARTRSYQGSIVIRPLLSVLTGTVPGVSDSMPLPAPLLRLIDAAAGYADLYRADLEAGPDGGTSRELLNAVDAVHQDAALWQSIVNAIAASR